MTSLVKTFGYTEDKELLQWVIERNPLTAGGEDNFGKLLWTKNCDQTVSVHQETLDIINSMDAAERATYLNYLKEYLNYFLDYDKKPDNITDAQKSKIIAYIVNSGEKFRYENSGKPDPYKFMGRVYLRDFKDIYKNEFKKNGYYKLPDLQIRFEKAKGYWEELAPENDGQ